MTDTVTLHFTRGSRSGVEFVQHPSDDALRRGEGLHWYLPFEEWLARGRPTEITVSVVPS